ncbi:glycosyltransferase, partial [Ferroplasma sp. Type II]|uniref:glycosyltransferase n=1 Tax=Ferroplasma sp. Type II TaxID=261388 RepID=UPI0025BB1ED9
MDNPYISVIIVAYNRKNYIKQAIESVLNQTLNQNLYEIIVVKNFEDMEIDDFINKNNIKNIYTVDQR